MLHKVEMKTFRQFKRLDAGDGMLCTYAGAIEIGVLSFGFTMKPMDT